MGSTGPESGATPLVRLGRLERDLRITLWAKRDDLFAATGGGNKARKIGPILAEAERRGCDALVTTGGLQSNHARAAALEAARRGWACTLVLHGDADRFARPQGNLLLARLAGARVSVVAPAAIASGIEAALQHLREQGRTPCMIPGGGHCLAGSLAYVEAVLELAEQCRQQSWWPDCVVVASGTGATQAGITAGFQHLGRPTRVIGVSVARPNPRAADVVQAAYEEVCTELGMPPRPGAIEVRDEWIGGGYEQPTQAALAAIGIAGEREGLMLDPTYTGKAFGALLELAAAGGFRDTPNVLFWHTGGLLNLMASSCFAVGSEASPESGEAVALAERAHGFRSAWFSPLPVRRRGDTGVPASSPSAPQHEREREGQP